MKKSVITLLALIVMVSGASATLGSPSSVKVESSNSFFNDYSGKVIVLEWTADRFDSSKITVQPSDVNGQIKGEINEPITLEITGKSSSAKYDIRNGGREKFRGINYLSEKWEWNTLNAPSESERKQIYEDWAVKNCDDVNQNGQIEWTVSEHYEGWLNDKLVGEVVCSTFKTDSYSDVAEIESTPTEKMSATFKLTVGSDSVSKTVSNSYEGSSSSTSSKTFSNFAKVNFQGGLESGYNFPQPDDELVAFSNNFNPNIRIIKKSNWENDYPSMLDTYDSDSVRLDIVEDKKSQDYYESIVQDRVATFSSEYSNSEFYEENLKINGNSLSDGSIEVVASDRVGSYPSFQVIIKADKVGYTIPDATPEIGSISVDDRDSDDNNKIEEGSTGYVQATVKNIGKGEADFQAGIRNCNNGFNSGDITAGINLKPGASTTVSLPVSFNSDSDSDRDVSGSCEVVVENLRDSSETVTSSVQLTGRQSSECTPKAESVTIRDEDGDGDSDQVILKCDSSGLQKSVDQVCGDSQIASRVSSNPADFSCVKRSNQAEICGNGIDDDGDANIDEGCGAGGGASGGGTGAKSCLVNIDNPVPTKSNYKALCFSNGLFQKLDVATAIVAAIFGGMTGLQIGRTVDGERRIQGRNSLRKSRRISRKKRSNNLGRVPLALAVLGAGIGAALGFYLGFLGGAVIVAGLLIVQFALPG